MFVENADAVGLSISRLGLLVAALFVPVRSVIISVAESSMFELSFCAEVELATLFVEVVFPLGDVNVFVIELVLCGGINVLSLTKPRVDAEVVTEVDWVVVVRIVVGSIRHSSGPDTQTWGVLDLQQ